MARALAAIADHVFASVLAPLVLGGPMRPSRPVGAKSALALLDAALRPSDADLASRVDLGRVRAARLLAPVDRVADPTGAEWALGAALHDLLQATSPRWVMRSSARRLLDLATLVIERAPRPANARDALMRHTWFARTLDVARSDARVTWWTGGRDFYGEEPPARLLAWPDLRRVHVARQRRAITELAKGTPEDRVAFDRALGLFLRATPLTDFATAGRASPAFEWSEAALGLVRTAPGRALALRAAARAPETAVDAALGRATRALLASRDLRRRDDRDRLPRAPRARRGAVVGRFTRAPRGRRGRLRARGRRARRAPVARRPGDRPRRRGSPTARAAPRRGVAGRRGDRDCRAPRRHPFVCTFFLSRSPTSRTSPRAAPARGTAGRRCARCPRSARGSTA